MLDPLMSTLRAIKEVENKWVDRYVVIILALLGFLVYAEKELLSFGICLGIAIVSFPLTTGIQLTLRKERISYYFILRTLVRAQNYLGLFEDCILPSSMIDSIFPIGIGRDKSKSGTKPLASFLNRMLLLSMMFAITLLLINYLQRHLFIMAASAVLLISNITLVLWIYFEDDKVMRKQILSEQHLEGYDKDWF